MQTNFLKHNGVALIGLAIVAAGFFLNQTKLASLSQTGDLIWQQRQADQQRQLKLQLSQAAAEKNAEIAESRYKSGCLPVVAANNPKYFTSLSEGKPVIDAIRKSPVPDNTIVCDRNGNTGVIIEGVVSLLAFTGNEPLVKEATARATARYQVPNQ